MRYTFPTAKLSLAILTFLLFSSLAALCQNAVVDDYVKRKGQEFLNDSTDQVDIHLYGITTSKSDMAEEMLLPGVTITMRDLYGEMVQINSDDSAFYSLDLSFDNEYQVFYQYDGKYTKFLVIDTKNVVDTEQERGYLLPTDMSMQPVDNEKIWELYLKKPIGKLYYDRRLQMLTWDVEYTDRLKEDVDKIKSKTSGRK